MGFLVPFIPLIAGVASVAGSIYSGVASKKANDAQANAMREQAASQQSAAEQTEMLAYQNAANTEAETFESARREQREDSKMESQQRARAAASGVLLDEDTSTGMYLSDTREENTRQVDWLVNAGLSRAEIDRWQGGIVKDQGLADAQYSRDMADVTQQQGKTALAGGVIGGIGGAISAFGNQTNAWGLTAMGSPKKKKAASHLTSDLPAYGAWK